MSDPPSLDSLKISDKASVPAVESAEGPQAQVGSSTPSTEVESNPPNASLTNGTTAASSTAPISDIEPPKPPTTAVQPNGGPSALPKPPLPSSTASAPILPPAASMRGRAPVGGPGAGAGRGMPMPMGMRGMSGQQVQSRLPPSLQAKMDKIAARQPGTPGTPSMVAGAPNPNATSMGALLRSQALGGGVGGNQPAGPNAGPLGLAARRSAGAGGPPRPNLSQLGAGMSAPGGLSGRGPGGLAGRRGPPGGMKLSNMAGAPKQEDNKFADFGTIMDPSGKLKFSKAVLHSKGVDFGDGKSFEINMDEMDVVGELGKGNYGSVQQVYHRPTGVMMAMKEIRLELDQSKLNGIIMELDILHRAVAPQIVEFFGAFTIESCVYYCMELMDAGSLDTLTGGGVPAKTVKGDADENATDRVPEDVLRRITVGITKGLKFLKDELQIMHRDVKPTNVLMNKKGEVKLVDFGVSGQLEKSLAKTNIGCQSYMAPERIRGESQNQVATYTVSSDVWSVGLSIIELAKGTYPYPPETFANVFAQLTAIVDGPAPTLPPGYSQDAQDFVAATLLKDPNARPTYAQMLEYPFLLADNSAEVDMAGWVEKALERRAARGVRALQPIDA